MAVPFLQDKVLALQLALLSKAVRRPAKFSLTSATFKERRTANIARLGTITNGRKRRLDDGNP